MKHAYMSGFGSTFETEAMEGALPRRGNSPQRPAYGLYAEQLSGSAFTAPRASNMHSWLYRIRPSVVHLPFALQTHATWLTSPFTTPPVAPNQLRWDPVAIPKKPVDFFDSIVTVAATGNAGDETGIGVHIYSASATRRNRFFYNADGEMLFVPESGGILFRTELGEIDVRPGEIAVIPRGIRFSVVLPDTTARGYICENYGTPFTLPELGPLGANALAYPRHFHYPVAAYEDKEGDFELIAKFDGALWRAVMGHSPLDVVAWHGNYAPYKYDLADFMAVNTVTYDHADPSIFTVLTSPSHVPGTANADFVIFPPRWSVAENTFRPPWFHRNVMSEFMGLIKGVYEGKAGGGFLPGGASLHNRFSAHGPDAESFRRATEAVPDAVQHEEGLAFMFESRTILRPTHHALNNGLQPDYYACWQGLKKNFRV